MMSIIINFIKWFIVVGVVCYLPSFFICLFQYITNWYLEFYGSNVMGGRSSVNKTEMCRGK